MSKKWLMNADVGEGYEDKLIMPYLDCANIACGGHAGDEVTMKQTLKLAKKHTVLVGAHPGYPDLENFGRISMDFSAKELMRCLHGQILGLTTIAEKLDYPLHYVKPHGALNHDMLQSQDIFRTICTMLVAANCPNILMVPTNVGRQWQQAIADEYEIEIWWEVFADRAYESDGLLRSRNYEDAMHTSPAQIVAQIERIIAKETIIAIDGSSLFVPEAITICIHGDHSPSVSAIKQWHQATHS